MLIEELEQRAAAYGVNLSQFHLDAFYAAGVDNWEGFDEALALYRSYLEDIVEDEEHGTN